MMFEYGLPSSTMEIRWPLPGEGYKTMQSSMFTQKRRMGLAGFLLRNNV